MATVYTMTVILAEGNDRRPPIHDSRFTFTATDIKDATAKAIRWAKYHGMDARDVIAIPASGRELAWPLHNEWVD